ncbi:hypothetical protein Leryth_000448 [Lithospermum erythrorhizon]|nr:hypothetical protein Leryth_000448 [Lithospermum erythrorhizon]
MHLSVKDLALPHPRSWWILNLMESFVLQGRHHITPVQQIVSKWGKSSVFRVLRGLWPLVMILLLCQTYLDQHLTHNRENVKLLLPSEEGGWMVVQNRGDIFVTVELNKGVGMYAILDECTDATELDVEEHLYRLAKASGNPPISFPHIIKGETYNQYSYNDWWRTPNTLFSSLYIPSSSFRAYSDCFS